MELRGIIAVSVALFESQNHPFELELVDENVGSVDSFMTLGSRPPKSLVEHNSFLNTLMGVCSEASNSGLDADALSMPLPSIFSIVLRIEVGDEKWSKIEAVLDSREGAPKLLGGWRSVWEQLALTDWQGHLRVEESPPGEEVREAFRGEVHAVASGGLGFGICRCYHRNGEVNEIGAEAFVRIHGVADFLLRFFDSLGNSHDYCVMRAEVEDTACTVKHIGRVTTLVAIPGSTSPLKSETEANSRPVAELSTGLGHTTITGHARLASLLVTKIVTADCCTVHEIAKADVSIDWNADLLWHGDV